VKGRAEGVAATSGAVNTVTAGFNDVDFTGSGPGAVFVVLGKHPDGGPEPITLGELCNNLNAAVLEVETLDGANASGHHGVEVVAGGGGVALAAVEGIAGANVSGGSTPEIEGTVHHGVETKSFTGKGGLDVENAVINESVGTVVPVHLKFPVTATTHGELVLPLLEVESVEVVLEDEGLSHGAGEESERNLLHN
jgi:hypothetical protein